MVAVSGCFGLASTEFHPKSAVHPGPVTERAVRFYEDDIDTLGDIGGEVIGTIGARGNAFADQGTLADKAAAEAAENGGTHFVLTKRGAETFFIEHAGTASAQCDRYGNCNGTYTEPTRTYFQKPTASYVVVRVAPRRWNELPKALRPEPLEGVDTTPLAASAPSNRCAQRRGAYDFNYAEQGGGTCGPIAAQHSDVRR